MPQGRSGLVEWCCVWPFFAASLCRERKKIVIVLIGLDSAGKSTLLARLRKERLAPVLPTCGFSCKKWKIQDFSVFVFDLGGRKGIRGIWPHYFAEAYGAMFVIDSTEKERFIEAKHELENAVNNPFLLGKPVLVVANKQGFESAMRFEDIKSALRPLESAHNLAECKCDLQEGGLLNADLQEGLQWLLESIGQHLKELRERVKKDAVVQNIREDKLRVERKERTKRVRETPLEKKESKEKNSPRTAISTSLGPEAAAVGEKVAAEETAAVPIVDLLAELEKEKHLEYSFREALLLPGQCGADDADDRCRVQSQE